MDSIDVFNYIFQTAEYIPSLPIWMQTTLRASGRYQTVLPSSKTKMNQDMTYNIVITVHTSTITVQVKTFVPYSNGK